MTKNRTHKKNKQKGGNSLIIGSIGVGIVSLLALIFGGVFKSKKPKLTSVSEQNRNPRQNKSRISLSQNSFNRSNQLKRKSTKIPLVIESSSKPLIPKLNSSSLPKDISLSKDVSLSEPIAETSITFNKSTTNSNKSLSSDKDPLVIKAKEEAIKQEGYRGMSGKSIVKLRKKEEKERKKQSKKNWSNDKIRKKKMVSIINNKQGGTIRKKNRRKIKRINRTYKK